MQVDEFEQTLLRLTRTFDSFIHHYQSIVQQKQFETNQLTSIEDISSANAANSVIDLSHKILQPTVFTSALIIVPSGTTSLLLQFGRWSFTIDNPSVITNLFPIQYILGQADSIKATITPAGAHPSYMVVFGHKTGGNNQL